MARLAQDCLLQPKTRYLTYQSPLLNYEVQFVLSAFEESAPQFTKAISLMRGACRLGCRK